MKALAATGRAVPVVLAALLGVVAGLGALLGAAKITDRPPLFLLAGLLTFCAAYLIALLLATRGVSPPASGACVRSCSAPAPLCSGASSR